ncbi:hypothetical protein BS78_K336500 [Paspalum vaginatum]|uniref:Zinc finger GRF-type domain-containing protein n=1 Tax=Paspalum vaginatum TaxID=158149 RepID=A0A9W8CD03_9POAL|nr:hypothetical protein BS78_K336500 [Paspalum vaginatum]
MSLGSSSTGYRRSTAKGVTMVKVGTRTGLPLVPCPKCGSEVLELRASDLSKIPGQIFFKCRRHENWDPGSCPFYMLADKYEKFLRSKTFGADSPMNMEETTPELAEQVGRLQNELDHLQEEVEVLRHGLAAMNGDVQALKNGLGSVDVKCSKMMNISHLGLGCQLVVVLFVVVGVVVQPVK